MSIYIVQSYCNVGRSPVGRLLGEGIIILHQQIRALRSARKMSQVELANILGVSKQSVSNWENDNIQPSVEMLVKLADVFSVSTDYLLGRAQSEVIDVTGLPREVVAHVNQIVDDLRR